MAHFADAVIARTIETGCPVAAGLDPRPGLLSDELKARAAGSPRGLARAYEAFADGVLTGLMGVVPVVKIQIAFFEALGIPGVRAYAYAVRRAKELGFLVIGDIKRGDIGSTAEAYAAGHVGAPEGFDLGVDPALTPRGRYHVDAVTLNPYLGVDSLAPFLDLARTHGKGAFALVRTSNPSAREIQDLVVDGRPVFSIVADRVQSWGEDLVGSSGYSSLGAVVGATYPEELAAIRAAHPKLLLLIPGYGAQGGGPSDVISALDDQGAGALIASSRGILRGFRAASLEGRDPEEGIRDEATAMRDAIRDALEKRRVGTGDDPARTKHQQ